MTQTTPRRKCTRLTSARLTSTGLMSIGTNETKSYPRPFPISHSPFPIPLFPISHSPFPFQSREKSRMRKAPAWWRFFTERILGHAAFASCIGFFVFGFDFVFGEIPDFPLRPAGSRVDPGGVLFCFCRKAGCRRRSGVRHDFARLRLRISSSISYMTQITKSGNIF